MTERKFNKNIFFNTLLTICQFIFPLITFPYLARVLMPEGLGFVNFLDNIIQYLIFIAGLGIPIYGIREIARFKDDKSELSLIYNDLLVVNLIAATVISLIYVITISILHVNLVNYQLYLLSSLIILFNVFTIEWLFQGLEEFSYITKRSISIKAISILGIVLFVKNQSDLPIYYCIMISSYLLNSIINISYAHKKFGLKINLQTKVSRIKTHFKPILLIFSANLAISIFLYLDSFLLGILKNNESVGFYVTAIKIVKIPVLVIGAFVNALIPKVSYLIKTKEYQSFKDLISKSFDYIAYLSIPITIGVFLSADFLVYLLAGSKYSSSVLPLQIMSPIIFFLSLNNIFVWQILTPLSKERFFAFTVIIGMIVSVSLNFVLIPIISFKGTAITTLITETVICLLSYYYSKKSFEYNLDVGKILRSCIACIPMVLIFFIVNYLIRDRILNGFMFISCSILSYIIFQFFIFKNNFVDLFKNF